MKGQRAHTTSPRDQSLHKYTITRLIGTSSFLYQSFITQYNFIYAQTYSCNHSHKQVCVSQSQYSHPPLMLNRSQIQKLLHIIHLERHISHTNMIPQASEGGL